MSMYMYIYICIYMCIYVYIYMCVCPLCPGIWVCGVYICMCYIYVYLQSCGQIDRAKQNRIESFTADFLRDFVENVISFPLGGRLGTCCQIQAFQGFYCDFLNSQVFSRLVRQFAYSLSSDKI